MIFNGTLLELLDSGQRTRVLQAGKLTCLRRQDVLPAELATSWILVVTGILRIETTSQGELATGGFLKKGEFTFFGREKPKEGTNDAQFALRAVLATDVLAVPADLVHDMALDNPRLAMGLLSDTLDRAHRLYRNIAHITSAQSPEHSVSRTLFELSTPREDGSNLVDRRISQREIAESLGLSREQVNKVLRSMEQRGLVLKDTDGYALHKDVVPSGLAPLALPDGSYDVLSAAWRLSREKERLELDRLAGRVPA